MNFLRSSILFLYYAGNLEPENVIQSISGISERGAEEAMSTATKLMEIGKQEGLKEGIEKGKITENQETLAKFMETKFDGTVIDKDIEYIKNCNDITQKKRILFLISSGSSLV